MINIYYFTRKPCYLLGLLGFLLLMHPASAQLLASTDVVVDRSVPEAARLEEHHLDKLIVALQKQYKTSLLYEKKLLSGQRVKASLNPQLSMEDNLSHILSETKLTYEKIDDKTYVVVKRRSHVQQVEKLHVQPLFFSAATSVVGEPIGSTTRMATASEEKYVEAATIEKEITGTVMDEEANEPLPGVNVVAKGTTIGTITDVEGNYTLSVPDDTEILVFSSVGYGQLEETIGGRTTIDVALSADITELGEVVVTALGIERDSKTLGYATATVDPEQLSVNRTPNVMNSLQGKVAGVNISGLGTGPGGTSKIRIRGQSSISGQNNPLIVINGVPMDNSNFGSNPGGNDPNAPESQGGGVYSDGGDGLSSINPDDIESMTVLKGATAAALYGSRAKDGVIMITTKKGGDGEGIGVTYNLNYTNESPLDFTDYQYEYGQGEFGVRPTTPNPTSGQWSFGERFQPGMTQVLFDGVEVPYVPVYDRVDKFFRNGQNVTNTIALSSAGEKGGFHLSLSNLSSQGIVPNNSFTRRTVNLGVDYALSQKLNVTGSVNYSNEYNKNPPNIGNQDNTIPVALYNMANSMPLDVLDANKYDADGNEAVYSRFRNRTNPYFTLAEQFQNIRRDRVFGNVALKYDVLPWMYVQGRIGQDFWSRSNDVNNFPTGQASRGPAPDGFVNGVFTQEALRFREINADFLVSGFREFGDIGLNVSVGGNRLYRRRERNFVQVTDFVIRDLYTVQNGRLKEPSYQLRERQVNSLYGTAELSFRDFLFLNGTLRNDWFSVLSASNRSILYPSLSASYVFSESLGNLPSWLSFGKIRAAYAEVGSDTDVQEYSNVLFYEIRPSLFANPSGNSRPVGRVQGSTVPNPELRPMRAAEAEVGLNLKMFDERVGIDMAVYQKNTTDQIVSAQVSDASGYINTLINSGESQTRGIEMLFTVAPVRSENFSWDITLNAAYNKTQVLSLQTDSIGEEITVGTHVFNGFLKQVVGQEIGQLSGFGFQRDAQGRQVFGADGVPLRTDELVLFGSALPTWVGGITNTFNYRGLNLSFLIDFKLGNMMMSGTNFNATRHGLHKMTLEGREGGVVGVGVNEEGEVNDVAADVQTYWEVVRSKQLVEPIVYNGGYWKLRQITLGYDFTRFLPDNFPARSVRLSFVANNVLILKKWVPNIDPETFGYSSDNLVGLESTGLPSTRGLGLNLNVKF